MRETRPVMFAWRIISALAIVVNGWPFLALAFGWIDWTTDQLSAFQAFLGLALAAIALVLGVKSEAKVTPVADPRDGEGRPLYPFDG